MLSGHLATKTPPDPTYETYNTVTTERHVMAIKVPKLPFSEGKETFYCKVLIRLSFVETQYFHQIMVRPFGLVLSNNFNVNFTLLLIKKLLQNLVTVESMFARGTTSKTRI